MITVIVVMEEDINSPFFNQLVISHGVDELGCTVIMENIPVDRADYVKYARDFGYVVL